MSRSPSNILDRPLGGRGSRSSAEAAVSQSSYAYLYSELVQYHQSRVASISELERRLESSGYTVGLKVLELLAYRARETKRETRLMNILQFVSATVWKSLFGKPADSLERSIDHADEFMIVDYEPLTSTYVSVPSDLGQLSVDAYISGIIAGVLDGAGFTARVTAHSVTLEDGEAVPSSGNSNIPARKDKAVFLVKFAPEVLQRDATLDR
mmetsp:Transcript_35134/g.49903  ORF Transcript_35134/g.49903 Transcript_35134/m.49903 type:complete len:210 (-) Transcript_35134:56-685(-)|eukprot:CAMPEP_0202458834 /NCGR_PEP_ID=MMETSP1360-20130828/28617_1 /ASSEMBLY_ACC=CAM_ASM_000848 /TAXON_ID=515479 /ORGANISM="Licmophora paradoxa, Strain CCMP2313" /LENGTH=209 /DNA_ID=CAMNT_0049079571 /DNA_START=47 /DNA_END=676 /DNA_ORIENTATION=+